MVVGDTIYYASYQGRELRRIRDGRDDLVCPTPHEASLKQIALSPRDDRVAFVGSNGSSAHVCTVDLAHPKPACHDGAINSRPAFGANGSALYFAALDGIHRLTDDEDAMALPGVDAHGGVAISPDGTHLVYSACGTTNQIFDVTTTPPTLVVAGTSEHDPAVGPHGELAWIHSDGGTTSLMLREADGRVRQLTAPALGVVRRPLFAPDGHAIVFGLSGQEAGIYQVAVDQPGPPMRVTSGRMDGYATWADARAGHLVYAHMPQARPPEPMIVDADGSNPRRFSTATRLPVGLGPDRREVLVLGPNRLHWWNPRTGKERRGPPLPASDVRALTISPDGRWVAYLTGANSQLIWRGRTDGRTPAEKAYVSPDPVKGISIRDDGHVLSSPTHWSGDLHVVAAAPGTRF